jgi:hypothetical protein
MENSTQLNKAIETQAQYTFDVIQEQIDILQNKYWKMHDQIRTIGFDTTHDQFKALKDLGQLAIAIDALITARGQFSKIR